MASSRIVVLSSLLLLALVFHSATAYEDYQTEKNSKTSVVEEKSPNVGDESYQAKKAPETSYVEEKSSKIGEEEYLTKNSKTSVGEEKSPNVGDEDYQTKKVQKTSYVEEKSSKIGDEEYLTKKVPKTSYVEEESSEIHDEEYLTKKAPKQNVVVEGIVYCQDCKRQGTWSLLDAKPLSGAKISVICKNHRNRIFHYSSYRTDDYGYFYAKLEGYTMGHYLLDHPLTACKVKLVSSSQQNCNIPTNTNYGISGASLRYENKRVSKKGCDNVIYASGPFAFRPAQCTPETQY